MVTAGEFREDLWFRLNVFPIVIPSRRNRKFDIPSLVHHFIDRKSNKFSRSEYPVLASGAMDTLMEYHWPGNVRELENIIERAMILNQGTPLNFNHLLKPSAKTVASESTTMDTEFLNLDLMVSNHIKRALDLTNGKIHGAGGAAELLGINANTLRSKKKKLGIKSHRKS